jgi:putative hydrolase of the HAD superfamily
VEIDKIWMKVLQTQDQEMARAFAEEYELLVNPIYPMPHVRELLSGLKNKNICMGIISNAQFYTPYLFEWFLNSDLKGLGFQDDLIAYSFRFGCAKPSLSMFRHVADRLARMSIKPGSVLYLGNDMLNDIYPAATIGFQTALFAGDARSLRLRADNPLCRSLKPDFVVTDLIQVLDFV